MAEQEPESQGSPGSLESANKSNKSVSGPVGGHKAIHQADDHHAPPAPAAVYNKCELRGLADLAKLADIDENELLHVTGRIDRLVISGGEKIDPREVEDAVSALAGIEEVMALGLPDPEWGQKLVVYYTGQELADWKERLKEELATYKLAKEMWRVDRLPLDDKGKFLRPS